MNEQEHVTIVKKLYDNLNRHDLTASNQYLADNFHTVGPGAPGKLNRDESIEYTQRFIEAFPDLSFKVKDIVAQGNLVAVTWMSEGTHKNPLHGPTGMTIPTTNQKGSVPGSAIYEFRDGKIVRQEFYWDMVTLLMQLGVMEDIIQSGSTRR